MRKRLAAVLAAMMVVSAISPAVYAEDATAGTTPDNPVEFSYEDIDETVYDGAWFETGLGFDVYLPEEWEEVDITDEMAEAGLMFMAGEPGGGANIAITAAEIPAEQADTYDIKQLGEELAGTVTTAMYADLSGIPAVIFENEETKVTGFSTVVAGYIVLPRALRVLRAKRVKRVQQNNSEMTVFRAAVSCIEGAPGSSGQFPGFCF